MKGTMTNRELPEAVEQAKAIAEFIVKQSTLNGERDAVKWGSEKIESLLNQAREAERENVKKVIEQTIENDYHNIGMGSLDYHEKCAVDAFIESFLYNMG